MLRNIAPYATVLAAALIMTATGAAPAAARDRQRSGPDALGTFARPLAGRAQAGERLQPSS